MPAPLLTPNAFSNALPNNLVLDIRVPDIFELGFIPGSINIGLNGMYEYWLEHLVQKDRSILLITSAGKEIEGARLLLDLGYSQITGVLSGGIEAWRRAKFQTDIIISITPEELLIDLNFMNEHEWVLDVRTKKEQDKGRVEQAIGFPLENIYEKVHELNPEHTYYLYCSGGYRSMIAASVLKSIGFNKIKNIYGGYTRIAKENEKRVGSY